MGVYIGKPTVISDMQGPCPDGFHVPTVNELNSLVTILITSFGLPNNGNTTKTYLKMPLAGDRMRNDGTIYGQGASGYYWGCDGNQIKTLSFALLVGAAEYTIGASIRPFKDEPAVPDNSRTTIYSGIGSAGIFHNTTLGLISISSDGTNWITIADKNLGATIVCNDGDTLSEANCGKYYQWGNNYGFPRTGNITTSSTKVDASNYGPGNYYSSDTFITASSSPYSWDSSNNDNLWGGVSQGTTIKSTELKNAYIGEYHTQIFDFQNDGDLGWTGVQLNTGQPFYTSGEGWTVGDSSTTYQEEILPPNSVYDGKTLQKVKIWLYKGVGGGNNTVGVGIMKVGWTPYVCWTQTSSSNLVQAMLYDGSEHRTSTTNETGEVAIEYVCNDDGTFTLSINGGTPYNLGNYATLFRNAWSDGTLGLSIGRWAVSNGNIYIRKVQIETA